MEPKSDSMDENKLKISESATIGGLIRGEMSLSFDAPPKVVGVTASLRSPTARQTPARERTMTQLRPPRKRGV